MKVGLIYDPVYLRHDTGAHPENASRLRAVMGHLEKTGMLKRVEAIKPRPATVEEIALVHDPDYVRSVARKAENGGGWLDMDTYLSPASYEVALYAAGGVITGVEKVMEGVLSSAFALVRPPGHHAGVARASGFCIFNNVAVAARYALKKYQLKRIVVADFDVHHGNGTQDIFYQDPSILYFSTHQYPFYPGTGAVDEAGEGMGVGNIVNVPLPAMSGDDVFLRAYSEVFVPAASRFRPELVLVSAGYDAHWADSISMTQLTVGGYVQIVRLIKGVADEHCQGRMALALEGGYNTESLSACVKATLEVLMGDKEVADPMGKPSWTGKPAGADAVIQTARRIHGLE
ncbi:MAG: histone deacetylase [Chloroflexi bacterium]|nr:histone deacetylase [Chloroflexota bacterium]